MRVKRGVVRHRKHKKLFNAVKGFRGQRRKIYRRAKEALLKAGNLAYRDRRVKKRVFRQDWIRVINNACRANDTKYSEFIKGLNNAKIELNRKMLAEIAKTDAQAFSEIVKKAKAAL